MGANEAQFDSDRLLALAKSYSNFPGKRRIGRDILAVVVLKTAAARVESMQVLMQIDGARYWSTVAQSGRSVLEDYMTLHYCNSAVVFDKNGRYESTLDRFKDFSFILIDDELNHWSEYEPSTDDEVRFKQNFDRVREQYASSSAPFVARHVHPWSGRGFRRMGQLLVEQHETLVLPLDLLTKFYKSGSRGTHLNSLEYDDMVSLSKTELEQYHVEQAGSLYLVSLLCLHWILIARTRFLKPTSALLKDLAELESIKLQLLRALAS